MLSIKIIKPGSIKIEAFEHVATWTLNLKDSCGVGSGSTVTYIKSGNIKILVDTGFDFENDVSRENLERNKRVLIQALNNFGLKPEDIDFVFITHWHRDHFGNMDLFKNSQILASEGVVNLASNTMNDLVAKGILEIPNKNFRAVRDGEKIADDITVMYTPGHTANHASLILDTQVNNFNAKVVVAGDAIVSSSYYIMNKVWKYNSDFYSEEEAIKSMEKIKEIADYIIPGHGSIFTKYY